MIFSARRPACLSPDEALPGRPEQRFAVRPAPRPRRTRRHRRGPRGPRGRDLRLGCFWGAEEIYWQMPGVWSTSVGYAGGSTPNPSYDEVCSGMTGHTEAVRDRLRPGWCPTTELVRTFFEVHDPTQGMRQGNDVGTQYRSAIYTTTPEQAEVAERAHQGVRRSSSAAGLGPVTTEIAPAPTYYYAEDTTSSTWQRTRTATAATRTGVPFPKDA